MNYHLSRQGQTLGAFSIEELQAQRRSGELNGRELVWRAGMAEWEPLDRVLGQVAAGTAPPPLPPSAVPRHANLLWVWLVVAFGGILVMAGIVWIGVQGFKAGRARVGSTQGGNADAVAIAGRPIVWHTNTMTQRDVQKRARGFRGREWVAAYEKNGDHSTAYDAAARQFLEKWIAGNHEEHQETNQDDFQPLGDRLADHSGCTDPLILTATAATSVEIHESIRRLERALSHFEGSKYSAFPQWNATVTLADKVGENTGRVQALDSSALDLFQRMFHDGSLKPDDQPEMVNLLFYSWARYFFLRNAAEVVRLTREAGKDYQWLALVLDGQYQINEAWRARGNGASDSVSERGWEGFKSHSALARASLTKAWQLRPDLPEAASRMVYVAMGDSGLEQMRLWFDRAVAAQIDYLNAWYDLRWGLRPRWYGSLEAMRALGVAAVNTRRFDTVVPHQFFAVVSDLQQEQSTPAGRHIYGRADLWPVFQQMYEGYLAAPSESTNQAHWQTEYAIVAYFAGHYDIARQQLEPLHWMLAERSLSGWGRDLSLMPLEVAGCTGPAASQVAAAETAYRSGQPAEPDRLYRELSASTNLDALTREFVQRRLPAVELEQRLHSGEWVDFMPQSDDDPNWVTLRGNWHRLPDGSIEVSSGPEGHMLYCRSRVGPDFEVRGELEVVRTSNKSFQGGLVMGLPNLHTYSWHAFRIKRNDIEGQLATLSEGWSRSQVYQKLDLSSERNAFVFRYQRGRASASVNGHEVFKDAPPPRGVHASRRDFLLGIGAFNDMNDTVIRYRNLQVRWLGSTGKNQPEKEQSSD